MRDTTLFPNVDEAAEAIDKVLPPELGDVEVFTYDDGFQIVTVTAAAGWWQQVYDFCDTVTNEAPLFFEGEHGGVFRLWLAQDYYGAAL